MLLVALFVFGASSVAASQMTTANGLILTRALMGIAGAFLFPISLAILPTIFSERERPRAIAIGGAGGCFSPAAVGPVPGRAVRPPPTWVPLPPPRPPPAPRPRLPPAPRPPPPAARAPPPTR